MPWIKFYHKDCAFFTRDSRGTGKCMALIKCDCEKCSFYKTREKMLQDRARAMELLKKSPNYVRLYRRYYLEAGIIRTRAEKGEEDE